MSCPLYKDYTRECIPNYKSAIQVNSFDLCDSDDHSECPLYKIIFKKVEFCEYTHECDEEMNFGAWSFEHIKYIVDNFCFNRKQNNCAIYRLRKEKKEIPKGLQPDGKIVELEI